VSPASCGLSYPDCPIASRSEAGTYLIATYGAGAKARPSTRWGWTIKSAKMRLALRSGWYGCYQHRRDRMRLSSPSNVIRSCHGRRHCPPAAARHSHRRARPARGGPWLLVAEILGKFGGIKSQPLATNPRRFCGDVESQTAEFHHVMNFRRMCWASEVGDCYSVLPRIRLLGRWGIRAREGPGIARSPDPPKRRSPAATAPHLMNAAEDHF
jgi:hypothetical protein